MALNLPTFYKRTASAIVFAIIMLAGLLWNNLAFLILVCLINAVCLRDYFRLMQKIDKETYWHSWLPWVFQGVSIFLICRLSTEYARVPDFVSTIGFYLGLVVIIIPTVVILAGALSKDNSLLAVAQAFGGLFYITVPMLMLPVMHNINMAIPIGLILMIWSNDTLAYLLGSFIGKTPFSPISPNKTWEGTAGGALLTIIGAGIYGYFAHTYRFTDWMMLALCATVAGTLGDLLESKLKRMADVKDSGTLMPGHGGALDRFDSLLVATPFAFTYAYYFMH